MSSTTQDPISHQPTLEIYTLGAPRVLYAGVDVTKKLPTKAQALLFYLVVTGEIHSRQTLAGLFWGNVAEAKALTSLRVALNRLRKVIPDGWNITQLALGYEETNIAQLDVRALDERISAGLPDDWERLRAAVDLYRGDFLDGFTIGEESAFDEWVVAQRTQWQQRILEGLDALMHGLLAQDAYADTVELAQRYLQLQPWAEEIHRVLMISYGRLGNFEAALEQYQICRRALRDELNVDPMPETVLLYERLESAQAGRNHNLPADGTPFVGRAAELAQIREMVRDPDCRLLTLLGPGGIGKTRLAVRAAQQLMGQEYGICKFFNGAFFVPLDAVNAPSEFVSAIANAVGFTFYGGVPLPQQLFDFLRTKEVLLIVDGVEHLLDGVDVLADLLEAAPDVTLMATSREALNLHAEWTLDVRGLALPPADKPSIAQEGLPLTDEAISDYEAVQLFAESARRVTRSFTLNGATHAVAQICRLVEGMPLAIELAAAWLGSMDAAEVAQEIAHSLDILVVQRPELAERHQSIRAVLHGSWEMLDQDAQRVLRRLAVFRGGFTQEAATQTADASWMDMALFTEKSLLHLDETGRYQMHGLLRQFAAEKLADHPAEERATFARHSAFYLDFLCAYEDALVGAEQRAALAEIGREIDNVRTGWRWAVAEGQLPVIQRSLDTLYHFYQIRSRYVEGEESFALLVERMRQPDMAEGTEPALVLAKALARRGAFGQFLCDFDTATLYLQESLTLTRALAQPAEEAFVLNMLGQIATWQGEKEDAQRLLRRSLAISRAIPNPSGIAYALEKLANTVLGTFGEYAEDKQLAEECLALCRQLQRPDWIAYTLDTLGFVTFCWGEYDESRAYYNESVALFEEIEDRYGAALALGGLGLVSWAVGGEKVSDAVHYFERSLSITRAIGNRGQVAGRLAGLGRVYNDMGEHGTARRYGQEALTIAHALESPVYVAHASCCLADAALGEGDYATAHAQLRTAIRTAWDAHLSPLVALGLLHYATLLAQESDRAGIPAADRHASQRQALRILARIHDHASLWHVFRMRAERLLAQMEATAPAEIVTGMERNAAHDQDGELDDLVRGILGDPTG